MEFMPTINLLHSILRWVLLALLILNIFNAYAANAKQRAFGIADNKLSLWLMIVAHTQLLIGLIQYIVGPWGIKNIQQQGMGVVMKSSYDRFFAIEHITMMLIAIILIQIGRTKMKKAVTDKLKFKSIFIYSIIALVIIMAAIPWPFRSGFESLGWL
jgi:hypothetical protein